MTERSFKVGDVISMDEVMEELNKFISRLICDKLPYSVKNHSDFVEGIIRYRKQIKLKIVELPEVD